MLLRNLLSAVYIFVLLKVVYLFPLETGESLSLISHVENDIPSALTLDQNTYMDTRYHVLRAMEKSGPNVILNQMFDNITQHFIPYSKYLASAPTTELMQLRINVLKNYTDAREYTGAVAKFDKFVLDFRPKSSGPYDKYAFSIVDFMMFPDLGVWSYTPNELKRIRANVVKTLPAYLDDDEKARFMVVVDSLIPTLNNNRRKE